MIKQNGRNVDTMDLYIRQGRKPLLDHARISQAKPRKSTRPTGFTPNNVKDGAAKLASVYKRLGNKLYGKVPKSKAMEVYTKRVSEYLSIDISNIKVKSRTFEYVQARQIIYYFARRDGVSLANCAKYFNQDHTTVIHAIGKIEKQMSVDMDFRALMHNIESKVK
jgi:hypothetical protein